MDMDEAGGGGMYEGLFDDGRSAFLTHVDI